MSTVIKLHRGSGGDDGYKRDLPLDRDIKQPVTIDAADLGRSHPMFLVRLRLFVDWHLAAGHEVNLVAPVDTDGAQQFAEMDATRGLADTVVGPAPVSHGAEQAVIPLRRLRDFHDVEDVATDAARLLHDQLRPMAVWGNAMHMAISELCDNALQHGRNDLGVYVAADRVDGPQPQFRLAVADLGIGIPEHIRARHPEWHDDTAAITRALHRGVTGTGDPHRGNGFAEVFDAALETLLVRTQSEARIDIRSAKGHVEVALYDGVRRDEPRRVGPGRRGTWIVYTVTSVA